MSAVSALENIAGSVSNSPENFEEYFNAQPENIAGSSSSTPDNFQDYY